MLKVKKSKTELKEGIGTGKKLVITTVIAGILAGAGFGVGKNLSADKTTANTDPEPTTSDNKDVANRYDADYFYNGNLDVNSMISNNDNYTIEDMIANIEKITGVKLDTKLIELYNARYLKEELNDLDIPENKIWSTLIGYRSLINDVADYGMPEYKSLVDALEDNIKSDIKESSSKLKDTSVSPFNLIDKNSYAYKTYHDRYAQIVDKQASYIRSQQIVNTSYEEEIENNAIDFYKLIKEIIKAPVLESETAKMLEKNGVDTSKIEVITVSEGIILLEFAQANKLMFMDTYIKIDSKNGNTKYYDFFNSELENYFDTYDEIMRKYYNLSKKDCEEVENKIKETEEILYKKSNGSRKPSSKGKTGTVSEVIEKSKPTGEDKGKTKVKPGNQVVDPETGEKADVKVDEKGNGSADVTKPGGEVISHEEEVVKPAEKIDEGRVEPEDEEDSYEAGVISGEEYKNNSYNSRVSNIRYSDLEESYDNDYSYTKH